MPTVVILFSIEEHLQLPRELTERCQAPVVILFSIEEHLQRRFRAQTYSTYSVGVVILFSIEEHLQPAAVRTAERRAAERRNPLFNRGTPPTPDAVAGALFRRGRNPLFNQGTPPTDRERLKGRTEVDYGRNPLFNRGTPPTADRYLQHAQGNRREFSRTTPLRRYTPCQ